MYITEIKEIYLWMLYFLVLRSHHIQACKTCHFVTNVTIIVLTSITDPERESSIDFGE